MEPLRARFRERAAADREALREALASGNRRAVQDIAHKLAGVAGMLGHPEVTETALVLEEAAEGQGAMAGAANALDAALAVAEAGAESGTASSS